VECPKSCGKFHRRRFNTGGTHPPRASWRCSWQDLDVAAPGWLKDSWDGQPDSDSSWVAYADDTELALIYDGCPDPGVVKTQVREIIVIFEEVVNEWGLRVNRQKTQCVARLTGKGAATAARELAKDDFFVERTKVLGASLSVSSSSSVEVGRRPPLAVLFPIRVD